jgi:coenzyme PQQ precursor peptide PqqA
MAQHTNAGGGRAGRTRRKVGTEFADHGLGGGEVSHRVDAPRHCHFPCQLFFHGDILMQWTTPAFTDLRFGFEITMYIANR